MSNESFETALPESFDPATHEGTTYDLLPIGTYAAQITDATVRQPQSGDGYYIALTWQITEGDHEGRYVWQNITFQHRKAQAENIGRKQFKDLCDATGISEQVNDVSVFKFIPCQVKLGIERDKQGVYPDKNRVSRILPLEDTPKPTGKPEPKTATAKPESKPAATGNGAAPPWRKPAAKPTPADDMSDEVPF
jgi:hypothetical protein